MRFTCSVNVRWIFLLSSSHMSYQQQRQFMAEKKPYERFTVQLVFQIKSSSFRCSKQQQQQDGHHPVQPPANTGSGVSNTHEPRCCCTVHNPLLPPIEQRAMNKYCATCNSIQSFDKKFIHCLGWNSKSVRPSTFLLSDKLKCALGGRPRVNTRNLFSHPISGLRGEPDPSKAEATMWVTSGHPASSQSPGW